MISSALEKHNQDPKQASKYELIQLLPEGKGNSISSVAEEKIIHSSLNTDKKRKKYLPEMYIVFLNQF